MTDGDTGDGVVIWVRPYGRSSNYRRWSGEMWAGSTRRCPSSHGRLIIRAVGRLDDGKVLCGAEARVANRPGLRHAEPRQGRLRVPHWGARQRNLGSRSILLIVFLEAADARHAAHRSAAP
jgi:hypothetical protein